jgi:hypothetical protein
MREERERDRSNFTLFYTKDAPLPPAQAMGGQCWHFFFLPLPNHRQAKQLLIMLMAEMIFA